MLRLIFQSFIGQWIIPSAWCFTVNYFRNYGSKTKLLASDAQSVVVGLSNASLTLPSSSLAEYTSLSQDAGTSPMRRCSWLDLILYKLNNTVSFCCYF